MFCDDLSFEEGEAGYKALKSVLDGSVAASGDNVLIYATSNRRHLMPEYMSENLQAKHQPDGEIHPGETVEEKSRCPSASACGCRSIPSSRTTTWTSSTTGCASWVARNSTSSPRTEALQWTLERGSRSGRVAYQFARDWAARHV